MADPSHRAQFCTSFDGTRIAYSITGSGPRLVRLPHWLTNLGYDHQADVWRTWMDRLAGSYTLLRMDTRGTGLSDREVADVSFDAMVRDLEAVMDACSWEHFALLGQSQGGALGIEYAVRHPQRVTRLVLYGGYARGHLKRDVTAQDYTEFEAQLRLMEVGWGRDDPAYRQLFATQFMPDATLEQLQAMNEKQRAATSGANAARILRAIAAIDVRESAARIRCSTLVLHATGDRRVPFEEGRLLAALIPGARLVALDSKNHIPLPQDPSWEIFFEQLNAFVQGTTAAADRRVAPIARLTAREADILERLAQGLDNAQIAAHLGVSEKTVRNHVSHIFDKMGVENRGQAIIRAREAGFGQRPS